MKVKTLFLSVVVFFGSIVYAESVQDLEKEIGSMLMVGFYGTSVSEKSQICQDIKKYDLAGVILFDYNPIDKNKPKNIASKEQLKTLSAQLRACSKDQKLLIAIDQEGGKVQRLKSQYGFYGKFPSAAGVSKMSRADTLETYRKMGKELKDAGINYDLAPVVDLAINSKNHVIYELGRSYGANPKDVAASASLFLQAMHEEGVLTSLKHFPGHGSSLGDTHKGYVDVTKSWSKQELEPFKLLKSEADSVMVAHVFNANIDPKYPATLSKATVQGLLRDEIGFEGKIVFLDFFGHQCPPCLASIDIYKNIQEKYKDDIIVLGIEVQGLTSEELQEFGKSKEINYRLVSQDEAYDFLNYITVRAEWEGSIPFLLIIDDKGVVQLMHTGMIDEKTFEEIIAELKKPQEPKAS